MAGEEGWNSSLGEHESSWSGLSLHKSILWKTFASWTLLCWDPSFLEITLTSQGNRNSVSWHMSALCLTFWVLFEHLPHSELHIKADRCDSGMRFRQSLLLCLFSLSVVIMTNIACSTTPHGATAVLMGSPAFLLVVWNWAAPTTHWHTSSKSQASN